MNDTNHANVYRGWEVMPPCVLSALMPIMAPEAAALQECYLKWSTKDDSFRDWTIVTTSCYDYVRAFEGLLSTYGFSFSRTSVLRAFVWTVRQISDGKSLKPGLNAHAAYLFPQSDEVPFPTAPIIGGCKFRRAFRTLLRRVQNRGSLDQRASLSLSVAKLVLSLTAGTLHDLEEADVSMRTAEAPVVDHDAEVVLFEAIKDVVKEVYHGSRLVPVSDLTPAPNRGAVQVPRSVGCCRQLLRQAYGPFLSCTSELHSMFEEMIENHSFVHGVTRRRVVRENRVCYPNFLDLWGDCSLEDVSCSVDPCHIVSKGKVRTVTKFCPLRCLMIWRFQQTFLRPIWRHRSFKYTCTDVRGDASFFKNVTRKNNRCSGDTYFSGDYQKCTDRFNPRWTLFTAGLIADTCKLSALEKQMVISTFDLDPRLFLGQPQGHGLSFAILCVINAAILLASYREHYGYGGYFSKLPIQINGDDCVFRGDPGLFETWSRLVKKLGLLVSDSKTFKSETHFTMNSRAFNAAELCSCPHVPTQLFLSKGDRPHYQVTYSPSLLPKFTFCPRGGESEGFQEFSDRATLVLGALDDRPLYCYRLAEERILRNSGFCYRGSVPLYVHPSMGGFGMPTYRLIKSIRSEGSLKFRACRSKTTSHKKAGMTAEQFSFFRFVATGPKGLLDLPNQSGGTPTERIVNSIYKADPEEYDQIGKVLHAFQPYRSMIKNRWTLDDGLFSDHTMKVFGSIFDGSLRRAHFRIPPRSTNVAMLGLRISPKPEDRVFSSCSLDFRTGISAVPPV